MVEHKLKCWCNYFDAIAAGDKPFEARFDDRGYQKGDILVLQKFDHERQVYVSKPGERFSTQELRKRITYVMTGGRFGVEPGWVILGLGDVS